MLPWLPLKNWMPTTRALIKTNHLGGLLRVAQFTHKRIKTMWIADGKRLIALEGRDIKLECRDIVFEGKNIEILRHQITTGRQRSFSDDCQTSY